MDQSLLSVLSASSSLRISSSDIRKDKVDSAPWLSFAGSGCNPSRHPPVVGSPDLRHWGNHKLMLARRGAWWDANKIGMSPPPVETPIGWLMIYHGVRRTPSSSIYRLGLALFALEQPETCLIRGDSWMFAPEADYERHGDVQDVVFPCGYTIAPDGDTINLYYGAADSSIALARGSIRKLLAWLDANGHSEQAHDRRQRHT